MDVDYLRYKYEDAFEGVAIQTKFRIGIRHVQILYMFACATVMGFVRGGNAIGIMSMTDLYRRNDTSIQVFDWSKNVQGICLSSYIWGYTLMMIPAELFLRRLKGKLILTAVLLVNGTIYAAMPTIAKEGNWIAVMNAQLLLGMTQSCLVPAIESLVSKWLPPHERNRFSIFIYSGIQLGTLASYPAICQIATTRLGWELVYYVLAMMMLSATAIWGLLTANSAAEHPAVGDKEKEFVVEGTFCYSQKPLPLTWCEVLKTKAFWGLAIAHVGSNAVFIFFLFETPVYLYYAMGLPWHTCGWLTLIGFASSWLTYLIVCPTIEWIYDFSVISYVVSVTQFRKIVTCIGTLGVAIGFICLSYLKSQSWLLALVLCGTLSFTGLQYTGFLENHRDMTQFYPGSLLMMTSVVSNGIAAAVPLVVGLVVNTDLTDMKRWRIVFLILATFSLVCNIIYMLMGRAKRQPWDKNEEKNKFGYSNDVNNLELRTMAMDDKGTRDEHGFLL